MSDIEEPEEAERVYYRHQREGTRGYIVKRDGVDHIKLDRAMEEIVRPFQPAEWMPERESRPFNRYQSARVAFEADKALCLALGQHDLSRREWLSLRDEERVAWETQGPKGSAHVLRVALYRLIKRFLASYTVS